MAGEDFFKFNKGNEFRFSNFREIKEEDLKSADEKTKKLFNIFAGEDKILQEVEAKSLFNVLKSAAGDNKVLEDNEIKAFAKEHIGEEVDTNVFMDFVNRLFDSKFCINVDLQACTDAETARQVAKGYAAQKQQTFLEEAACKEIVIDIIDENLSEAYEILNSQYLGSISGWHDERKDKNDILKTSNVSKVLDYQNAGIEWMNKAKLAPPNGLTKKEYYEGNKQRIKDMILTRVLVLDTNTKFKELKNKYSEEKLAQIIGDYVEQLCSNASIEDLKDIQKQFVSYSGVEEIQALENVVDNAIKFNADKNKPMPYSEVPLPKFDNSKGIVPEYWNSDEPISFEEVYKIERGTEYSQYKIEQYALAKKEMEVVANAYNKKQQFIEFAEGLRKDETLSIEEKTQKVLEGFATFYALAEDGGLSQLQELIAESKLPISIDENGFNFGTLDDSAKNRALNSLLKLAQQSKEKEFEEFLNGKTIEDYQIALAQAHDEAIGDENGKMMAEAMKNDNLTCIQRWTGNTSMAGMGMTIVGGILCFTPLAPLGAGMITVGNTLAIGGMVAKTGLGVTDYATKDVQTAEEAEQLTKDFIMDAGGFIIGMGAGKAGLKAFSKLIDKKLVAVFGQQIASGNKMQALKTVFTNPEYLKNFMTAAGAKLSADFVISYAGDLAMMGILDTQDDWQSLLKANLTGILVGMSGDIKDVSGVGRPRNFGVSDGVRPMTEMDYGQRLLGNDVTVADPKTGATVEGTVTGLYSQDGQVEIEVNGQRYSTNDVAEVLSPRGLTTEEDALIQQARTENPADVVADKVKQQWLEDGLHTRVEDEPVDLFNLDPNAGLKVPAPEVNGEVTSLIFTGKLKEALTQRYNKMGRVFNDIAKNRSADFKKLAQECGTDKQAFADGVIAILAEEMGMKGLEPKIEIVEIASAADGLADWTKGTIKIGNNVGNAKKLIEIISHEFVHMLQYRDVLAQYGEQGLREIVMNDKDIPVDKKEATIKSILESDYTKELLNNFNKLQNSEKGSLSEYITRIYKDELSNPIDPDVDMAGYVNQVAEREAYNLGSEELGNNTEGLDNVAVDANGGISRSLREKLLEKYRLSQNTEGANPTKTNTDYEIDEFGQINRKNVPAGISSNVSTFESCKNLIKEIFVNHEHSKFITPKMEGFFNAIPDEKTAKSLAEYFNRFKDDQFQSGKFAQLLFQLDNKPENIKEFVRIIESSEISDTLKAPATFGSVKFFGNDTAFSPIMTYDKLVEITKLGLDKIRKPNACIDFNEVKSIMQMESEKRDTLIKVYTSKLFSRVPFHELINVENIDFEKLELIDGMIDELNMLDRWELTNIESLLHASKEELEIIESRNLLKEFPDKSTHFTPSEALELCHLNDELWQAAVNRGLYKDMKNTMTLSGGFSAYEIREYASLPDGIWENIERRNLLNIDLENSTEDIRNFYRQPENIIKLGFLNDTDFTKYQNLIKNPSEEIFLLKCAIKRDNNKNFYVNETALSAIKEIHKLLDTDDIATTTRIMGRFFNRGDDGDLDLEAVQLLKDFVLELQEYRSVNPTLLSKRDITQMFDAAVDNEYSSRRSNRNGMAVLGGVFKFSIGTETIKNDIKAQKIIFDEFKKFSPDDERLTVMSKVLPHINRKNFSAVYQLLGNKNLSSLDLKRLILQSRDDEINYLITKDVDLAINNLNLQKQKVLKNPDLYINGEIESDIGKTSSVEYFFDKNYACLLTLATALDKEGLNHLLRLRFDDAVAYMSIIDTFDKSNLELLYRLNNSTNIDGKPFMPTQKVEFIDLIDAYKANKLDMSKMEDMVASGKVDIAQLQIDLFNQIMKNSGLTDAEIASIPKEKLIGWDYKYAHLLSKAINEDQDIAFNDILRAGSLEPDFIKYIHDKNNIYGQTNSKTKEMFEELGLDYDKWIQPSKDIEMKFFAKDKNAERLTQIGEQIIEDMNTLMENPMLKNLVKKRFAKFIKEDRFFIPNEYLSNKAKLEDLVLKLTDTSEQGQLRDLWKRAQDNSSNPDPQRAETARRNLTVLSHLGQRLKDITNVGEVKTTKTLDLTIKMWDRNPQKDMFQGNYSTCCIGMGECNASAMPHFIMNTSYNMIELVDNTTGKTIGNALCYFVKGESGKPMFIIDNVEIADSVKPSNDVGEELRSSLTEYASQLAKDVTGKDDIPIYMSTCYNDIPFEDLPSHYEEISFLGDIDCESIYMDLFGAAAAWVSKEDLTQECYLLKLK